MPHGSVVSLRAGGSLLVCLALTLFHATSGRAQAPAPGSSRLERARPDAPAGRATIASHDAASSSVGVVVFGARLPGLEASLLEALGRAGMTLNLRRDSALSGATSHPQGSIQVWIEATPTGGASVLIADAETHKILENKRLNDAPAGVLEEQLTLLVRTAVETTLELRRLTSTGPSKAPSANASARFAALEANVQLAPSTPDPAPSAPQVAIGAAHEDTGSTHLNPPGIDSGAERRGREAWRARGWVLELTPHVSALHVSNDIPTLLGAGLDLGVEGRQYIGSLGATLGFERFLESQVSARDVGLSLASYRASLLGRWSPLDRERVALSVLVGPSVVATSVSVHDLSPALTQTQSSNRLDLTLSFRTELRWWMGSQIALVLAGSLDVDPARSGFATSSAGTLSPVVQDAQLRPGASLGIASDFPISDRLPR